MFGQVVVNSDQLGNSKICWYGPAFLVDLKEKYQYQEHDSESKENIPEMKL